MQRLLAKKILRRGTSWNAISQPSISILKNHFVPDGTLLAFLHIPEVIANLVFDGTKRNRLFMTDSTSIYAIYVNAVGAALS